MYYMGYPVTFTDALEAKTGPRGFSLSTMTDKRVYLTPNAQKKKDCKPPSSITGQKTEPALRCKWAGLQNADLGSE